MLDVTFGGGLKAPRGTSKSLRHPVADLQHHRQPAIGLAARRRDHPVDHFLLQHEVLVDHAIGELHEPEQQRRRDVVRQVADDAQRSRGERRPVELQCVGFDQGQLVRRELLAQPGGEIAIDLDGGDVARAPDEFARQRGLPGADLDDRLVLARLDRIDDPLDHAPVMQEVLAEALARAVLQVRGVGHRRRAAPARRPARSRRAGCPRPRARCRRCRGRCRDRPTCV